MRKRRIIATIVTVLVALVLAMFWKVYVQELGAQYAEEEERLNQMVSRAQKLERTFFSSKPEAVVRAYEAAVEPWMAAVQARSINFATGSGAPVLGPVPLGQERFWYEREYERVTKEYQDLVNKSGAMIPPNNYNAKPASQVKNITAEEAIGYIQGFLVGDAIVRKLIDENVLYVNQLRIWPKASLVEGAFEQQTYGIAFEAFLDELTSFMNSLVRDTAHLYQIHSIQISSRETNDPDPLLDVKMLFSEARYIATPAEVAEEGTQPQQRLKTLRSARDEAYEARMKKKSFWQKLFSF